MADDMEKKGQQSANPDRAKRVESPDNRVKVDNRAASRAAKPVSNSQKRAVRARTITKKTRTATVNVALRSFPRQCPLGSPGLFGWDFFCQSCAARLKVFLRLQRILPTPRTPQSGERDARRSTHVAGTP